MDAMISTIAEQLPTPGLTPPLDRPVPYEAPKLTPIGNIRDLLSQASGSNLNAPGSLPAALLGGEL